MLRLVGTTKSIHSLCSECLFSKEFVYKVHVIYRSKICSRTVLSNKGMSFETFSQLNFPIFNPQSSKAQLLKSKLLDKRKLLIFMGMYAQASALF